MRQSALALCVVAGLAVSTPVHAVKWNITIHIDTPKTFPDTGPIMPVSWTEYVVAATDNCWMTNGRRDFVVLANDFRTPNTLSYSTETTKWSDDCLLTSASWLYLRVYFTDRAIKNLMDDKEVFAHSVSRREYRFTSQRDWNWDYFFGVKKIRSRFFDDGVLCTDITIKGKKPETDVIKTWEC